MPLGRWVLMMASTASAKAMSVAVGIAQPVERAVGAERDQHVDQRRHGHAADGGQDRQGGPLRVAQVAGDELALELEPDDEEEDRQQPVRGPGAEGEVEVERGRTDREVAQRLVGAAGGRVDPDQRHHGAEQQQRAADGLLPQDLRDARGLGPGTASQERTARVVLFTGHEGGTSRGRRKLLPTRLPGAPGSIFPQVGASTPVGAAAGVVRTGLTLVIRTADGQP